MLYPSIETVRELSAQYNTIPVFFRFPAVAFRDGQPVLLVPDDPEHPPADGDHHFKRFFQLVKQFPSGHGPSPFHSESFPTTVPYSFIVKAL